MDYINIFIQTLPEIPSIFIQSIQIIFLNICIFFNTIISLLEPLFQNFDPSLIQTVILGILAIFIPFTIVFLTDILTNSQNNSKSDFEKMVLNDEIFETTTIFIISVFSLFLFSFFKESETNPLSINQKIFIIIYTFIIIYLYWNAFKKVFLYSEGNKEKFEISFLNKLKYKNKEKIARAWNSFLSQENKNNYKNKENINNIFISHIEFFIKKQEWSFIITIFNIYIKNIKKRDFYVIIKNIVPQILDWDYKYWNTHKKHIFFLQTKENTSFINKYLPTIKKWYYSYKKTKINKKYIYNEIYFRNEVLPQIINITPENNNHFNFLLKKINTHIDKYKKDTEYLENIFSYISPILFNNINKIKLDHNYIFKEWKTTLNNKNNTLSQINFIEFLKWTEPRIKKINPNNYIPDENLTKITNLLFPNVHSDIFPFFLILFFTQDIEKTIITPITFYINNNGINYTSYTGPKSQGEINELFEQKEEHQKKYTAQLIFEYFFFWKHLKLYTKDITETEIKEWQTYDETKRNQIIKKVRNAKLNKLKTELNSSKINSLCKKNDEYKYKQKQLNILLDELIKYNNTL